MSESVLREALLKNPTETEWLEFKHNNGTERQIGEYISALSNAAALAGQRNGYLVWGEPGRSDSRLLSACLPDVCQ